MSGSTPLEPESDNGDRVIDRSGDIDQRPIEERLGPTPGSLGAWNGTPGTERRLPVVTHPVRTYSSPPAAAHPRSQRPQSPVGDIAQRCQKDLDKQFAKASSRLDDLVQKIEAQEKRCATPKLDEELQHIRFQRQKVLIANGPALADHLREERDCLADLERFKAVNRLFREPHYPSSPMLGLGVLLIIILVEAGINGVLFAGSSDQGLFGGWLEALVLSIANTGAAFLAGRLVLPQLHRRGVIQKTCAAATTGAVLAAIVAISVFGAHYRDFKAGTVWAAPPPILANTKNEAAAVLFSAKPATGGPSVPKVRKASAVESSAAPQAQVGLRERNSERDALQKAIDAPLDLQSFTSVFLLAIGLCGAAIALWDGYKFDDPFPGYGKRHRRYADARVRSASALRRILNQSNALMDGNFRAVAQKVENHAHEMTALLALHHAYAGDRKALGESLEETARNAEAEIACHDRLANKLQDRALDIYAVALKPLPPLGEKHVKFYETQEKKLRTLQRSAQKERSDALGVFDAASEDFQALLAEASHTSLQAARTSTPFPGHPGP